MPQLHLLGTGGAFNAPNRTTTMLALTGEEGTLVIDCGADVVQQMAKSGIDTHQVAALIITHEHADHCTGFPLFIEKLWLSGRKSPFQVYAIPEVIAILQQFEKLFNMASWAGLPPIIYHVIDLNIQDVLVIENTDFKITGNQVLHPVPTVGLEIQAKKSNKKIVYSCDTAPCVAVAQMAVDADILIHEAACEENCPKEVHTTFKEAAAIAQTAQVKSLILVHLPAFIPALEIEEATQHFSGKMIVGEDNTVFEI